MNLFKLFASRLAKASLLLLLGLTLAQQSSNVRVITIEYPKGERTGNLRNGPWTYSSNESNGIIGKVKDLQIISSKASLVGKDGKTMQEAQGERTANFEGGVTVKRDRMTASGPKLTYRESDGKGILEGNAKMVQAPKKQGDDAVEVSAPTMTFEVDTNISTSSGGVSLKNGNQEGKSDQVYYEEDKALAIFNDNQEVVLVRKRQGKGDLTIRAKEIRSLTDDKRLLATGGITLVDGDITTTGAQVLYNDNTGIAIVIAGRVGNNTVPARSVNAKERSNLQGNALQHNVNRSEVQGLTQRPTLPVADFKKIGEK